MSEVIQSSGFSQCPNCGAENSVTDVNSDHAACLICGRIFGPLRSVHLCGVAVPNGFSRFPIKAEVV